MCEIGHLPLPLPSRPFFWSRHPQRIPTRTRRNIHGSRATARGSRTSSTGSRPIDRASRPTRASWRIARHGSRTPAIDDDNTQPIRTRAPRPTDHDPRIEATRSHTKQHEPRSSARRPRASLDRRRAQNGKLETAARDHDRAVPGQARDHIPTRSNEAYLVNSQLDNEHPIAQKKGRHMGALSRSMSSRSISQSPTDRADRRSSSMVARCPRPRTNPQSSRRRAPDHSTRARRSRQCCRPRLH